MSYVDPRAVMLHLTERDLAVLDDIERFRMLTTRLVQRLHFPLGQHSTIVGATKQTTRVLTRLADRGVVAHLQRRIGGARSGSQGYVWQLTSTGASVQRLRQGVSGRRRYVEPSPLFADHTLAVAETGVVIRELADAGRLEIQHLQTEPECWREYLGPQGIGVRVKPDLYAVTATPDFEDYFFIEVDLGTEHLPHVLQKCRAVVSYHATGIEQEDTGVFPVTLWITATSPRAAAIHRAISSDPSLPDDLFKVITRGELAATLTAPEDTS